MSTEEKDKLIEKYFKGTLSEAETAVFNATLQDETNFKEDVEAQGLLLDGLQMAAAKEELKKRFASFHKTEQLSSSPLKRRVYMSMAASVVLIIAFTSYAYFKLEWFQKIDFTIEKEEQLKMVDSSRYEQPLRRKIRFDLQKGTFNNAVANHITGGLGTSFYFPAGCFLKNNGQILADTLYFDLIEVRDSTKMADLSGGYDSSALRMFNLLIYHPSGPVRINPLTPPYILTSPISSGDVHLRYGGDELHQVNWREPLDGTLKVMTEPTGEMETFKEYIETVKLLDSVRRHYTLNGEFFELHSRGGMTLTSAFVKERLNFVKNYEKDLAFESKVNTASGLWNIYNAQHDLVFNAASERKSAIHFNRLPFYEFGWYVLRLNEEN